MGLIFTGVISLVLCILLLIRAPESAAAIEQALVLCGRTVIPNLFPFFVLSSFSVQAGVANALGARLSPLAKRLFRVEGNGACVFVIGILCGYPTGAKTAAELVNEGQLSKEDAAHLLPFCNNAGPLFVVGAVGSMLTDYTLGCKLYLLHLLSALFTGMVLSCKKALPKDIPPVSIHAVSIGSAIQHAMQSAVSSILTVCGYILFFSVLRSLFPGQRTSPLFLLLHGYSEVTAGAATISASVYTAGQKAVLLSAVMGFGGLCVLLQVWGLVAPVGISVKKYLMGKLLQSAISAGLAYLFLWDGPCPVSKFWVILLLSLPFLWGKLTNIVPWSIIRKESFDKGSSKA